MQMLVLAWLIGILVHDQFGPARVLAGGGGYVVAGWLGGPALLAGLYALACRRAMAAMAREDGLRHLRRLERAGSALRLAAVAAYAGVLALGGLTWLRSACGDWIGLDELLFVLPSLLMMLAMWWSYYPIDRRLRQAGLMRRIDQGQPIYPIWSRRQYLLAQLRHQVALLGVPLALLLTWQELLGRLGPGGAGWLSAGAQWGLLLVGAGGLFLATPLVIRHVWDTLPLPDGELRRQLTDMCRQHRVGVRQILLWRTFGGLVNAAVMGLVAPLRYILLSDALLDTMPRRQIEAVMAHELAHIRKHHIPWLILAAAAGLQVLLVAWTLLAEALVSLAATGSVGRQSPPADGALPASQIIALAGAAVCWLLYFGYVSRRFERQADAFAVQHLARRRAAAEPSDAGPVHIDPQSAQTMVAALQSVAELNCMSPARNSWRHGSILWRQAYLRGLVGRRVDDLPIDRQVRQIKIAAAIALALGAAVDWAMAWM